MTLDHLYVERKDSKRAVTRMHRRLHVCPAINPDGLHLSIEVKDDGGWPAHRAGLNLSPKQARKLRKYIERLFPDDA